MRKMKNATLSLLTVLLLLCTPAFALSSGDITVRPFVPKDPILPLAKVVPGMKAEVRTVVSGTKIISFPVKILGIVPRKETPRNLILIQGEGPLMETVGIAQGMSGSPVYVGGKLVGAIGYGWPFSDKRLGLVTPIEDMVKIFDWRDKIPSFSPAPKISNEPMSPDVRKQPAPLVSPDQKTASPDKKEKMPIEEISAEVVAALQQEPLVPLAPPLMTSGISERMSEKMGVVLGRPVLSLGGIAPLGTASTGGKLLAPGASIGGAFAWGDVTIGAIGTLTAVGNDGRFLGFGHPFMGRGAVAFPLMESNVVHVIPGLEMAFKLGYLGKIVGIVTQDRPQGIGGQLGLLAPAASCTLRFNDVDAKKTTVRRFQMMQDPFLLSQISALAITGSIEDIWGRKGQGTARITTRFNGPGLPAEGWARTNMFYSEKDLTSEVLKEFTLLASLMALNPFQEIRPFGMDVDIEITENPRILYVQQIETPKKSFYKPGEKLEVTVIFRGWRKQPFSKKFELTIPSQMVGMGEVLVRGGGIDEEQSDALNMGWRAISTLPELLGELDAKETNDQIVVEIRGQEELPQKGKKGPSPEDVMDDKLQAQLRLEKLKNGSMRVVRTNYYVHGLLRKLIQIGDPNDDRKPGGKQAPQIPPVSQDVDVESEEQPREQPVSTRGSSVLEMPLIIGLER